MTKNSDVEPKKKTGTEEEVDKVAEAPVQKDSDDLDKQNENIDLNEVIKKKDAELNELVGRMQRLAAEYDNFRKRTQKEKERIYIDALADVVGKLLPVVDNLERAVTAAEQDESKGLQEGINLIYKQTLDALDKLGVKPIETVGKCFDPEIHDAVMHIEDDSLECNIIVEEFQKGYIYKDEVVIRHSVVKVAN
ncbi:MAG TPA: nucleotide exchange factor GrpE [Clostridiaceae bacterium]|jgi:molecular chaperone GrpE|nr:nucleotide exchange factor GrpE [Clostridiaceae bacterium]